MKYAMGTRNVVSISGLTSGTGMPPGAGGPPATALLAGTGIAPIPGLFGAGPRPCRNWNEQLFHITIVRIRVSWEIESDCAPPQDCPMTAIAEVSSRW